MKQGSKHRLNLLTVSLIMTLLIGMAFTGCGTALEPFQEAVRSDQALLDEASSAEEMALSQDEALEEEAGDRLLDAEGSYTTKEEVALYLHQHRALPPNFITKSEAAALGWEASKGNLWDVADQKSIGGDRFGNREGLLPSKEGRQYYECDINYDGGYRGAERIVYSNDGLVYYTPDHYESFELLYGEE